MTRLPRWAADLPSFRQDAYNSWTTGKRPSRLWEWATGDRYRIARMLCAFVVTALLSVLSLRSALRPQSEPLRFTPEGTFQISIFEDLHFGENAWEPWGPRQDEASLRVMDEVLEAETPQLVVLNGDLITGDNTARFNSTDYLDMIVAPLVRRGLPWASTYGNHDSAFNLSREHILIREQTYPLSRTRRMVHGPDAGVSNYYLPVYPSSGPATTPALLLWFFDSRGGFHYQQTDASGAPVGQPDWVDESVAAWFTATHAALAAEHGSPIPGLAFVHIPTDASLATQTDDAGIDPHRHPGINDDAPLSRQAQGWCADGRPSAGCDYGGQDAAFTRALAGADGALLALFSGHDHGDTWCRRWRDGAARRGLDLCFGQHSGYGGYGSWVRGARQVRVDERELRAGCIDTWIRLEAGAGVVGTVTLNDTYGRDVYPATPNQHTHLDDAV